MINIFSVHLDVKWKLLQHSYFAKHTTGIRMLTTGRPVEKSESVVQNHCDNLSEMITWGNDSSEIHVVCDSDAFPVGPWVEDVEKLLESNDFVAVQRLEHHREYKRRPPHPCFVAWRPDKFDMGFCVDRFFNGPTVKGWPSANWSRLLRINGTNVDPLLCGLYGTDKPLIYHHGFGSRGPDGYLTPEQHDKINSDFWADPDAFIEGLK